MSAIHTADAAALQPIIDTAPGPILAAAQGSDHDR